MTHDREEADLTYRFSSGAATYVIDDVLFIVAESGTEILRGTSFAKIAGLLDGARSMGEITKIVADEIDADTVAATVGRLQRTGHLISEPSYGGYLEVFGARCPELHSSIQSMTVRVMAIGDTRKVAVRIASCLRSLGCSVRLSAGDRASTQDVLVAVVEDYLDHRVASVNKSMLRQARPWLLVKPSGAEAWIGPRFVPGETGCWNCLAARMSDNRRAERFIAERLGLPSLPRRSAGVLPGVDGMSAAMIAADILASLAGPAPLAGQLRTVRLTDFEVSHHPLVRLPQCPACGNPADARRTPEAAVHVLNERVALNRTWRERGWRSDDVSARLDRHVGPYLGVVSALTSASDGSRGSGCTYMAEHYFPMLGRDVRSLRRAMAARSSGRGGTPQQGRAAAVCEALERYCGSWLEGTPVTRSSWRQLDQRAVHPQDVLLFSPGQYAGRESWNEHPANLLHRVPEMFDESSTVDFTRAWSLTHAESVLVPAGLAWYGHPDLRTHPYVMTDSNGCAAGASLAEATMHALFELYERDAVAIWWYNRSMRPQVDLESLSVPFVDRLIRDCRHAGRAVWALDITTDLALTCYAAISCDENSSGKVLFGFGAHVDPRRAICRAVAELDQVLALSAARDAKGKLCYLRDPATRRWFKEVDCAREPWLLPHGATPLREEGLSASRCSSVGDVIELCVADLRKAGIETILVDQSRPDIDLSVARVIAPGMRHFWRRTAPGRLYDVPVRLGWQAGPVSEENLNPYSVFV